MRDDYRQSSWHDGEPLHATTTPRLTAHEGRPTPESSRVWSKVRLPHRPSPGKAGRRKGVAWVTIRAPWPGTARRGARTTLIVPRPAAAATTGLPTSTSATARSARCATAPASVAASGGAGCSSSGGAPSTQPSRERGRQQIRHRPRGGPRRARHAGETCSWASCWREPRARPTSSGRPTRSRCRPTTSAAGWPPAVRSRPARSSAVSPGRGWRSTSPGRARTTRTLHHGRRGLGRDEERAGPARIGARSPGSSPRARSVTACMCCSAAGPAQAGDSTSEQQRRAVLVAGVLAVGVLGGVALARGSPGRCAGLGG